MIHLSAPVPSERFLQLDDQASVSTHSEKVRALDLEAAFAAFIYVTEPRVGGTVPWPDSQTMLVGADFSSTVEA